MQPLVFLQNGDAGIIRRVSGSAGSAAGFSWVCVRIQNLRHFQNQRKPDCQYQVDSRIAVNEEMARHILVQTVCPSGV